MRRRIVCLHRRHITVALTQRKEIPPRAIAAHLKAHTARLLAGFSRIFQRHRKEVIDLRRIDLENDNHMNHRPAIGRIFCQHASPRPRSKPHPILRPAMKTPHLCLAAILCTYFTAAAQEKKPQPPQAAPTAPAATKPAPVAAKPATPAKSTPTAAKPAPAPAPAPPKPVAATFADKALEAAIRHQVFAKRDNQEPLTLEEVAQVAILDARKAGIKDLRGLEKCTALASITLPDNQITSLAPLQGLERLQFIDLAGNQVTDITPLATCKALQFIALTGNRVRDIRPLSGITSLTSLYLANNQIQDATPLFQLPKAWTLYLDGNQISSLAGIGGMKWLSMLSLNGNAITDLSPLEPLTELKFLHLDGNKITDLQPLHRAWKKDHAAARNWSPYCQITLANNPLTDASQKILLELKTAGARITP